MAAAAAEEKRIVICWTHGRWYFLAEGVTPEWDDDRTKATRYASFEAASAVVTRLGSKASNVYHVRESWEPELKR